MLKKMLLIMVIAPLLSFAQEKKFSSFELLYDIQQKVTQSNYWPEYNLKCIQFYNDTIFTLLIAKDYLTSIPLTKKEDIIGNQKIDLPQKSYPVTLARNKGKWYYVTSLSGLISTGNNNECKIIVSKSQLRFLQFIFFIKGQMVIYEDNGFEGLFTLYDLDGKLLNVSKRDEYIFMNPYIHENIIRDGYNEISVENNIIKISDQYAPSNYGNYYFVGGCQYMGFFVERDSRNRFVIRDLRDRSVKDRFFIPVKFKDTDLGIPEEDSFNLRVFSQDNNTFYFVTIKHKHLLIYKATR